MARYTSGTTWYKGNTHIHSTASDGGWTFAQLAEAYAGEGYDFLFRTDHWVCSDAARDGSDAPLLWLDGIELDGDDGKGSYYHAVCLGRFEGLSREMGFQAALASARVQGGLTILAHPTWTGNSFDEADRWAFDGVEVYNHVCQWLNGKGHGLPYWQRLLRSRPTLAFSVDDAHIGPHHPGWNGGWVMVQAADLSPRGITDALRSGAFYSTMGPSFLSIDHDGDTVSIETSPVRFLRLVGPGSRGLRIGSFEGEVFTQASFTIPPNWDYAYLDIEDALGRRAWTNTL